MAKTKLHEYKHIGTHHKYKYVYLRKGKNGEIKYVFQYIKNGKSVGKLYDTDIEAAKAADMYLIKHGKEPVNILKRK